MNPAALKRERPGTGAVLAIGAALIVLALVPLVSARAGTFPIGVSVIGGIGSGYYDMGSLNHFLGRLAQDSNIYFDGLDKGVNVKLEGRVWLYDRFALAGGYEHLWGKTESTGTSTTLTFQAPADIYTIGTVVRVYTVREGLNLCAGANLCFAESVYGTNVFNSSRVLSEYKGKDQGFEIYAEAHSVFLNPVTVGFQLGYRSLTIAELKDKSSSADLFGTPGANEIDYSGAFFYFTAGIRL